MLSVKFQEVQIPKIDQYIIISDNIYSKNMILRYEVYLIKTLSWNLNPITLIVWLNWYLSQWDLFTEELLTSTKIRSNISNKIKKYLRDEKLYQDDQNQDQQKDQKFYQNLNSIFLYFNKLIN